MSGHTPGPWTYYTSPQPNGCPIVGSRGLMVAMLAHSINYDDQKEEAISNARLISAAPDLLEALQYAIKQVPELADVPGIAAAIAKATGEQA